MLNDPMDVRREVFFQRAVCDEYLTRDFALIDVQYNCGEDLYIRRHDVMEAGAIYSKLNCAVFTKTHLGSSIAEAELARRMGYPVFGTIVLNEVQGRSDWNNYDKLSLLQEKVGVRTIVHLPTVTGRPHQSKVSRGLNLECSCTIIPRRVSDEKGRLFPWVLDTIKRVRDRDDVISTGHASKEEVFAIVDASIQLGFKKILVGQPANSLTGLGVKELECLASSHHVWVELCALTHMIGYQNKSEFFETMKTVSNLVYSSDLGQTSLPDVADWIKISRKWFKESGISSKRISDIICNNASYLLCR